MPPAPASPSGLACSALEALGRQLKRDGYSFVTPTPITQGRILARSGRGSDPLREVFGWNRPFAMADLPEPYHRFLEAPGLFIREGDGDYRARVRFSSLESLLLAHSGYPTAEPDAVFLGPDTYRFAQALRALADREPGFNPLACVDIGAGSGAGGLYCAGLFPSLDRIALLDINPKALVFAAANSALNGIGWAKPCHSDILSAWDGPADLIISNPPYLVDPALRAYRHGGGDWGEGLSLRILQTALHHLSPRGHMLVYTGSAIVDGRDQFFDQARLMLEQSTLSYRYDVLDVDVFGEELDKWPYDQADRIATVALHVKGSDL